MADVVSAWIDEIAREPVVLVGHSTGAQAALRVAAARPDLVGALALLGPTFPPEQRRMPALLRAYVRNSRHEPLGLQPAIVPYYLRGGPGELLRFIRSAQRDQPEKLITEIACPVLLARGEHDAFAPQWWVDRLTDAAPKGRSTTAPGAHTFPYQHGGVTASIIAEAAARTGSSGEHRGGRPE
ncbi:hypothetical protein Lesp02_01590 [Lentzea sp. NBRC 105346]|nr:hypothetical protein Lesp02_01590 [Lentzea sp. NBRC 105346]